MGDVTAGAKPVCSPLACRLASATQTASLEPSMSVTSSKAARAGCISAECHGVPH